MFEQKAFIKQHNSVFNGRVDTNRYASAFDSASLEPALTPSRSTDLRSEKSASYHNVSFADNLNPTSAMDADMPARAMSNIDFTQAVNTTLNTEVASSWNQTTAWNSGTGTDSSDFSGIRPAGFDWKKFGHGALDVVGALPIPVVSTAADLANAGWYAAEGDYKNAAMSAVGAVPGVGDAAKLALKAGDAARTARSTRTTASLTTRATPSRPPRPGLAPRSKPESRGLAPSPRPERPGVAPTPKPSARKPEPAAAPRRERSGRADPTPAVTPARHSTRRPDPSPSGAVKKPDPRRPDPQPGPTAPKKSEPSRAEGNPTAPGTREQPSRPEGQPAPVATKEPRTKLDPGSETRGLGQGNRNGDLTRVVHGSGSQRTGGRSRINDNLLRVAHGGRNRTARDESLAQVGQRTGVRNTESGGLRQSAGTTVEGSGSAISTGVASGTAIRNTAAATTVALASVGLAGSTENSSTTTSPTWRKEENPVTGRPYQSPQEYELVQDLTGAQREELTRIYNNPGNKTSYVTNLREDENGCVSGNVIRASSGTPDSERHNAYAMHVSGAPTDTDYFVMAPNGLGITYDGRTPGNRDIWEVKAPRDTRGSWKYGGTTNYGWQGGNGIGADYFSGEPSAKSLVSDIDQMYTQEEVASQCNFNYRYATPSKDLTNLYNQIYDPIWRLGAGSQTGRPQLVEHVPYPQHMRDNPYYQIDRNR